MEEQCCGDEMKVATVTRERECVAYDGGGGDYVTRWYAHFRCAACGEMRTRRVSYEFATQHQHEQSQPVEAD